MGRDVLSMQERSRERERGSLSLARIVLRNEIKKRKGSANEKGGD